LNPTRLALVTGGTASGKSRWAERLALAHGKKPVYIATAQAHDDEMAIKIAQHRAGRGEKWRLIEAPFDLVWAIDTIKADEIALIDCLTMWLSNHLLAENDIATRRAELLDRMHDIAAPLIFVTNEVGQCVVPDNRLARQFQQQQGLLNQLIAARADLVVAVMSGLPLVLKGQLPEVPA